MSIDFESFTPERLHGRSEKWSRGDAIGAGVAEMDFGIAPAIADVLRESVDAGAVGYPTDAQLAGVRTACAAWYARTYGWEVAPGLVHVTADVLTGLLLTLRHFLPAGAPVILPIPNYMPFLSLPEVYGHPVLRVPGATDAHGRYAMDLDAIDAAFRAGGRLLILCNPHNPVGRVYDRAELEALAAVVERHGGRVFSDEIHAPLVLDPSRHHVPYASLSPAATAHTVTAIAASKGWNIPGLKCAQLVLSEDDTAAFAPFAPITGHQASTPGLLATARAYTDDGGWLAEVVGHLGGNATLLGDLLASELPDIGYREPEGTYLAWLDTTALAPRNPSRRFAEHGVVTTDGAACGVPRFTRFNFAAARGTLEQAVALMAASVS
ncbi:MAG: MalY/PatB family protein [Actinomycetota bacterium]